jgi:hypothetical protein
LPLLQTEATPGGPLFNTRREVVFDLKQGITASGHPYRPSVVGHTAADGHWNARLEFVDAATQAVLQTDVETHQASEADLQHWAATLGIVYLEGALARAYARPAESAVHRRAVLQAAVPASRRAATFNPLALFMLGAHVLLRELRLLDRFALREMIRRYRLNPGRVPIRAFTHAQLVTFIATAAEIQAGSEPRRSAVARSTRPVASAALRSSAPSTRRRGPPR